MFIISCYGGLVSPIASNFPQLEIHPIITWLLNMIAQLQLN